MATALQLVNRVRRELRQGDKQSFGDELSVAILDKVNSAISTIFEGWDWDCDIRHDGIIHTLAARTSETNLSLTVNDATVTWPSADDGAVVWEAVANDSKATNPIISLTVTSDSTFGDTAFRLGSIYYGTSGFYTVTTAELETEWPSSTTSTASGMLCANAYVMESTVRKILSVRSQERALRLEERGRCQDFDRYYQRPHETISDNTELVVVGGTATSTDGANGQGASLVDPPIYAKTGLFVLLWPTPSSESILNFSYLRTHSEMTATTDQLANVDRFLEDMVVRLAFARVQQSDIGDADVAGGLAIEERVLRHLAMAHANQGRDPGRRRWLRSNFGGRDGSDFGKWPRNFGSGS